MSAEAEVIDSARWLQEWLQPYMGESNLNVGCGLNPVEGFRNIDSDKWYMGEYSAPFRTDMFDCILASHVMEHVKNLVPAMREIHRILKPGGYFIALTPYASSNDAVEDPTHVRYFTEFSWKFFHRSLYAAPGAGHYKSGVDFDFDVVEIGLVPYPEFLHDPELEFKRKHWRNVIHEMHAVLRAAK